MNRRGFLRALGMATVGTLAHEQLSWLVRQPVSVINNMYPYTASVVVTGLQGEDTVLYRGDHRILESTAQGMRIAADVDAKFLQQDLVIDFEVSGPEDKVVTLQERRRTAPFKRFSTEELFTNHVTVDEVSRDRAVWFTQDFGGIDFEDLG